MRHLLTLFIFTFLICSATQAQSRRNRKQKAESSTQVYMASDSVCIYKMQRYHEKALNDTLRIRNDFGFPVMVSRVHANAEAHTAKAVAPNYFKSGKDILLILSAPPRVFVQPYTFEYHITLISIADPSVKHTVEVRVKADINS